MGGFLFWVGAYNVFGGLLLMAMHHDRVADFVLRRATEWVTEPYRHEGFARMWLWWAIMTNLFLGVVMVRAATWPVAVQREVTLAAICVYAIGWLAVVVGCRRPRYGRGVYSIHVLWLAQMGWGAFAYWKSLGP